MTEASPSPPIRTTLTSLPDEILLQIFAQVDHSTSLSLASVCKRFPPLAEPGIWAELSLFLPAYCTDPPAVLEYFGRTRESYIDRSIWDAGYIEHFEVGDEAHREGCRGHIQGILDRGEERHWAMVRKVQLVPRDGTTAEVVALLGRVAATIQTLVIESYAYHTYMSNWNLGLDLPIAKLCFPALTHIRLGSQRVGGTRLVVALCNASPALVSLDVNLSHPPAYDPHFDNTKLPVTFTSPTQIRRLRIAFTHADPALPVPLPVLHELLEHVPLLEELSLVYTCDEIDRAYQPVLASLKELKNLRDLEWGMVNISGYQTVPRDIGTEATTQGEIGVRRLVFTCPEDWMDMFCSFPILPNLETIYVPEALLGLIHGEGGINPKFAAQLRRCPNLSSIHCFTPISGAPVLDLSAQLDKIDAAGPGWVRIGSVCHKGGELLLLGQNPAAQEARPDHPQLPWGRPLYTDFEGLPVHPDVIEKMRMVEGLEAAQWSRRGVEVGAAAWMILMNHQTELLIQKITGMAFQEDSDSDEEEEIRRVGPMGEADSQAASQAAEEESEADWEDAQGQADRAGEEADSEPGVEVPGVYDVREREEESEESGEEDGVDGGAEVEVGSSPGSDGTGGAGVDEEAEREDERASGGEEEAQEAQYGEEAEEQGEEPSIEDVIAEEADGEDYPVQYEEDSPEEDSGGYSEEYEDECEDSGYAESAYGYS